MKIDRDDIPGILVVVLIVFLFAFAFYAIFTTPKCKHGHTERVHHYAWTQFIWTGKMMVPIYHEAYDADEFVCDEYCKKGDTAQVCK